MSRIKRSTRIEERGDFEIPAVETFRYRSIAAGAKLASTRDSSEADRQAFVDAVVADGQEFADYIIGRNTASLRRLQRRQAGRDVD
jgi:hypothetical protein